MDSEKLFFKDSSVLITQSRIVIHKKTYAMRNISSVSMQTEHQNTNKLLSLICLLIGLIFIFLGYYWFGLLGIGVSAIFLLGIKPDFIVIISSNSGDINALSSKNKEYVEQVIEAINQAIIYRG